MTTGQIQFLKNILRSVDPQLLLAMQAQDEPTRQQRQAVVSILANVFSKNLGQDHEPTSYGKKVDELLGVFLIEWHIDADGKLGNGTSV